ncbi:MAG: LLM class flavin-dependent oxidoreductase [Chloroflexi bacterium]|nr:MAG: LLM class flavin-dependent oxidoreductase [Chloroflexota bacterium]
MRFAINVPNFGEFGEARTLIDLARAAEDHGWDGFFIWDHIYTFDEKGGGELPMADPFTTLAAIATETKRIRIGALVTPLPRRRPWKLAREAVTVDRLAGGRLILGAGIGWNAWGEYSRFGEDPSEKLHGEMLDEGLAILTGLWTGEPFSFQGKHYTIQQSRFLPTPVQSPRIPIWLAAGLPPHRPVRRAARWDGICPISNETITVESIIDMLRVIREERDAALPFDVVLAGFTGDKDKDEAAEFLARYAEAGVTWWQEGFWHNDPASFALERIRRGPPELPS